jgi:hypothetical protein
LLRLWEQPKTGTQERLKPKKSPDYGQNGKGQSERGESEMAVSTVRHEKREDEEHSNYSRHDKNPNRERND